jgi:integrase
MVGWREVATGFWVLGKMTSGSALKYAAAQVAGAITGAPAALPVWDGAAASVRVGATVPRLGGAATARPRTESAALPRLMPSRNCTPRYDFRDRAQRGVSGARIRWLRAVEAHLSPRDRCIASIPYYAGARISEVVRLDIDDVLLSARKGRLRLYGKGGKFREVDIHPQLRHELQLWLDERPNQSAARPTWFWSRRSLATPA